MLVADLTHFLDLPDEAPGPARRLAERLGRIVQAATAGPHGQEWVSALACTRRPGNKPCPGRILLARGPDHAPIPWRCSSCADAGTISNWADSPYDLRRRRPTAVGAARALVVSMHTVAVLREVLVLDPDTERAVHAAHAHGADQAVLHLTDDQLDELLGSVAAEANHAGDRRRQKRLDAAFQALEAAAHATGRA